MNFLEQPPAIQNLARLGSTGVWEKREWADYRSLGIGPKHIPTLIEILTQIDTFWEDDEDSPESWAPLHAWRALGQLQAVEALPAMTGLLRLIDEEGIDLVQEDLPDAFGLMGPEAVAPLSEYLQNEDNWMWARLAAADGLKQLGSNFPKARDGAIRSLAQTLEHFNSNNDTFNGFLIEYLAGLKAVEASPLVEQAFAAARIDTTIFGDWEDFLVAVGIMKERLTPASDPGLPPITFSDGVSPEKTAVEIPPRVRFKKVKGKHIPKLDKHSPQKNQKKKKKKK
jgi:HEAT repeat protein